jgi:phosphoglycerate kinase
MTGLAAPSAIGDSARGGLDLSRIKTIDGVDVAGKRVLVRADLNVPIENGKVADATRISRALPTLAKLARGGAKVVVLSHLGRPKGVPTPETSLRPVAAKMRELLPGGAVHFIPVSIGEEAKRAIDALKPGEVALLENLRYHKGEEKNDPDFAKALAALGDLYVNDAFSTAHRAHASIAGIVDLLPSFAGDLMMAEITALGRALEVPERPVMAIVGGAKVSTKIEALTNLVTRMDQLVVGGGMATTFLLAQGKEVGISLCEPDFVPTAKDIMALAERSGCEIVLPIDEVVAMKFEENAESWICSVDDVPADAMILDAGPQSVANLKRRLASVRTVLWNGPLGAFETKPFDAGTLELAREIARLTREGTLISVAGGGDTVRALNVEGVADDLTYVSTAGGAFLEWLGGHDLPAVLALARSSARAG